MWLFVYTVKLILLVLPLTEHQRYTTRSLHRLILTPGGVHFSLQINHSPKRNKAIGPNEKKGTASLKRARQTLR
jgi:hypothetical protein